MKKETRGIQSSPVTAGNPSFCRNAMSSRCVFSEQWVPLKGLNGGKNGVSPWEGEGRFRDGGPTLILSCTKEQVATGGLDSYLVTLKLNCLNVVLVEDFVADNSNTRPLGKRSFSVCTGRKYSSGSRRMFMLIRFAPIFFFTLM